ARVGYFYRWQPIPGRRSSWWGVWGGSGLDLDVLDARSPTGIPPVRGELCAQVAGHEHDVEVDGSAAVLVQVPFEVGARVGFGGFDGATWRGVVLGAAWSPSFAWMAPTIGDVSGFSWLGAMLSLDFATIEGETEHPSRDARFRIGVYLLPTIDGGPL